jgi:hypothetical protein
MRERRGGECSGMGRRRFECWGRWEIEDLTMTFPTLQRPVLSLYFGWHDGWGDR